MLVTSLLLFLAAAILGVYLLSFVVTNRQIPRHIALYHGPLAATGLLLLIVYAFMNKPAPIVSIIIFVLAAMGGGIMIYRDLMGKTIPKAMAIGHAVTALIGLVLLVVFALYPK